VAVLSVQRQLVSVKTQQGPFAPTEPVGGLDKPEVRTAEVPQVREYACEIAG
jgi:hypothetical protein